MTLADAAQRQDEAHGALGQVGLVAVKDDARVEQRGGLIGIFLAEIGADQPALLGVDPIGTGDLVGNLVEAPHQHAVDIAVIFVERFGHADKLMCQFLALQRDDAVDDLLYPRRAAVEPARVGQLEWPDDGARRVGPQDLLVEIQMYSLSHARSLHRSLRSLDRQTPSPCPRYVRTGCQTRPVRFLTHVKTLRDEFF